MRFTEQLGYGFIAVVTSSLAFFGCSSDGTETDPDPDPDPVECTANADCSGETPFCEPEEAVCAAAPAGGLIGWGDGSPSTVKFKTIYAQDAKRDPTDLAFDPSNGDIWIVNRKDDSVVIVQKPGTPEQTTIHRRDPAASHFMALPPAIAWGAPGTWATCGDNDNGGNDFMGPALFSADLEIFALDTPGGLGSHIDMLHSTSFCRGIAHEKDNAYWVFNSSEGSIDRYDFKVDHGPGNDDHADGEILRYVEGQVAGLEGTPSHMVYMPDGMLYIADTGNKRIVKLDTKSGSMGSNFGNNEPIVVRKKVNDAVLEEIVAPGTLEAPSGLAIHDGVIYVTDAATSRFYAFSMEGELLRTLDTGAPENTLAGLELGPDGTLYFNDRRSSTLHRLDVVK